MSQLEEILVIHHSHLDLGYTHSQPIVEQLHLEFIDQALDLLDGSDGWPEISAPKWTCEVTWPVLDWLSQASDEQIDRFRNYYLSGRIDVCALPFGMTPLLGEGLLPELMKPLQVLKDKLGVVPTTALQHDVNGMPWPVADLLLDSGVEAFFMGINAHCGGAPMPRPGIFDWESPSGRKLTVFNGLHYSMFDQFAKVDENNPETFKAGIEDLQQFLKTQNYDYPFVWISATNPPEAWDNSPPNPELAQQIQQWNDAGGQPRIRFATPTDVLDRFNALPSHELEVKRGDWTDYWNFGCGSTAADTALHKQATESLALADGLRQQGYECQNLDTMRQEAVEHLLRYNEHTWGSDHSVMNPSAHVRSQLILKQRHASEAIERASFLLFDALESLAKNPLQSRGAMEGVLVYNPSSEAFDGPITIPQSWHEDRKRLRCERFAYRARFAKGSDDSYVGPVHLEPGEWKRLPLSGLSPYQPSSLVSHGVMDEPEENVRPETILNEDRSEAVAYIESPFHRIEYHSSTGRLLSVMDKLSQWQLLADHSTLGFFEFVHERPDARFDDRHEAYYKRDIEDERYFRSCWRPDWKVIRETPERVLSHRVEEQGGSVTLVQCLQARGTEMLEQRVTLHSHTARIDLEIEMVKSDCHTPESIYFAFPVCLDTGWKGYFDTVGQGVELDADQLEGSSRGWVTTDRYAAICDQQHGLALFTPDAPMVQFGDFNFGRDIRENCREANPLLLAWPINNYWNTNFPASQPGRVSFRYSLRSFKAQELEKLPNWASEVSSPLQVHPLVSCAGSDQPR
ncbi:glycoside hydrolase [Verrucomicrobiaceae bacterium N1E253]|uniref:Glycoside hydrolase n=1 Tax=Oceaniferula marina TaxID=2748318 RepID=A0A851GNS4_9BACT|nr:glycoside hydrolase [Oceaniferula marina]NWK57501.1 glycoside hydrolase [Oceaniferula marina]